MTKYSSQFRRLAASPSSLFFLFLSACATPIVGGDQIKIGNVIAKPLHGGRLFSGGPWREYTVELPNETARAVVQRAGAGAYFRLTDCANKEVSFGRMYVGHDFAWSGEAEAQAERGESVVFTGLMRESVFQRFPVICGEVVTAGYELRHLKARFRLK